MTQISLVTMNDHDIDALKRSRVSFPAYDRLLPARLKRRTALRVVLRARWINKREPHRKSLRRRRHIVRIEMRMRIAQRMDVPERAVDPRGDLEQTQL